MASCSSLLSEEQVLTCSICLETFTEPVSIPCGHNFCKTCISNYWDTSDQCQCPLCKEKFDKRPELGVNTAFRDLVEHVRKRKVRDEERSRGEVSCDETHLRAAAFKKHKLVDPEEREDRMCKKHDQPLEFFCRKEETCVCLMCMNTDHKTHIAVPLEQEGGQRKAKLGKLKADIDRLMKTRSMKIQQIQFSVEISKREAEIEISDSVEVCTALVSSIQRSQTELIQVVEEKQKAAEKQAEGFIKELEQEITELKRRSSELEQLSHSEDNLHLIQSFQSPLTTPLHTKDWSQISAHVDLRLVGTVRRVVSQMEDTLNKEMDKLPGVQLERSQQYAVDVTLDPDTANPNLILSEDGKQVRYGDTRKNLPNNPRRFQSWPHVLGEQSISSGRFYYEVQVEGNTEWNLGMARDSTNRKGWISLEPEDGYWTIGLRNGKCKPTSGELLNPHSLSENPQKVGVFVDYEKGQVNFYNVEARCLIHSFTGCTFTDELYPILSPCTNIIGKKSSPLIITPLTHTA